MSETREGAALDVLRRLEWGTGLICLVCRGYCLKGHAPDCELAALLSISTNDGGEMEELEFLAQALEDDHCLCIETPTGMVVMCFACQAAERLRTPRTAPARDAVGGLTVLSSGTCQTHGLAVLTTHVSDGSMCDDYLLAQRTSAEVLAVVEAEIKRLQVGAALLRGKVEGPPVEVDPQWLEWAADLRDVVDSLQACVRALEGRDGADVLTELARARGVIGRIETESAAHLRSTGGGHDHY